MQEESQICGTFPTQLPPGSRAGALDPALHGHAEEDPVVSKGS